MHSKELENLLKHTMHKYKEDYNGFILRKREEEDNEDGKMIDFSLTFSDHVFHLPQEEADKRAGDTRWLEQMNKLQGKTIYYLRIAKIFLGAEESEKRVIFTTYRPRKDFKTMDELKRSMLMECVKAMMIGGLEYSEMLYMNNQKKEEEEDGIEA